MKRLCLALLLCCPSLSAWSLGHLAGVEIVDRDTGQTLPVYRHHGEYWVAGNPGSRYAVMITNLRGERLLAVTSVDGINVISGEAAAWNQSGYVFQAGQGYAINGWRKSNAEVADFNFTALPNSYAALTGRPANVGIIGVALFLEKRPPLRSTRPIGSRPRAARRSAKVRHGLPRHRLTARCPRRRVSPRRSSALVTAHAKSRMLPRRSSSVCRIRPMRSSASGMIGSRTWSRWASCVRGPCR